MPWLSYIVSNVFLASVLALVAWMMQRRLRQHAIARILWVLVLIKLVTPPLVSVPIREIAGSLSCTIGVCGCGQHARTSTLVVNTLPWILLAGWSVGAVATGWTAWCRWFRFRRLTAYAVPAPAEWQALAESLSARLSLKRPPEILAVPGRLPPLVVAGWRRPRMLLPAALLGQLDDSQKNALLLHELVHLRRRDHLVRMLELLVSVAYWWLPIVGSIGRQLRDCEEACCDAAVLAHLPQARRDYARLLLDVLEFVTPLPRQSVPHATAMSAAGDLERRLRAILDATPGTRRAWPAGVLAAGLVCAVLPCGLHYDFVRRPAPPVTSTELAPAELAPAVDETCPPGGDRPKNVSAALCCPS